MKLYRELEFIDGRIVRLPYSLFWGNFDRWRFGPLAGIGGALVGGAGGLIGGLGGMLSNPAALGMIAQGLGTGLQMGGTQQEGKSAQQIANARAMLDLEMAKLAMQNAQYARSRALAEAEITAERGRKLKARQKILFAAGGVKINVGAPLVVEAQTSADIATDIGYILEEGRQQTALYERQAGIYKYSADIEKALGKSAKKQSLWSTLATGLGGFGSLAMMGSLATPTPSTIPLAGSIQTSQGTWIGSPPLESLLRGY